MTAVTFEQFRDAFTARVEELQVNWEIAGFYSTDQRVYPFGTDTKVISTVFEALAGPLILGLAEEFGYEVADAAQTVYPDFTLSPIDGDGGRIAIDVKTTYRRFKKDGSDAPFRYTLGSFTSFLRSPGARKNILYPYAEYSDHWVLGFLYTRRPDVSAKVHQIEDMDPAELVCPYSDVDWFLQEKHRIVGLTAASGNTANMGSFPTSDITSLRDGLGPFRDLGKATCDDYWRNYDRVTKTRPYSDIEGYQAWKAKLPADDQ